MSATFCAVFLVGCAVPFLFLIGMDELRRNGSSLALAFSVGIIYTGVYFATAILVTSAGASCVRWAKRCRKKNVRVKP